MGSYKSKTNRVPVLSEKILTEHIIPDQRMDYSPALLFGNHSSGEAFRHSIAVIEHSEFSIFSDDVVFRVNLTPECFRKFRVGSDPMYLKTLEGTYRVTNMMSPCHSIILMTQQLNQEGLTATELIVATLEQISLSDLEEGSIKLTGKNLTSGNPTTKDFSTKSIKLSKQYPFDHVFITSKSKREIEKNSNFDTSTSEEIKYQSDSFSIYDYDFLEHPKQMVLLANKSSVAA